jgi:hypothetical protein
VLEYEAMSEEHTSEPEADDSPGSVFGNLPGSRPGTRSPRRRGTDGAKPQSKGAAATQAKARPKPKPAEKPKPTAKPKSAASPPPAREPAAERDPEAPDGGGLEDIAWAGVAAAAEAATLGVRLASRAIEALRGNQEERD